MKTYVGQKLGIIIRKQKCCNSLKNKSNIVTRCVDVMVHLFTLYCKRLYMVSHFELWKIIFNMV